MDTTPENKEQEINEVCVGPTSENAGKASSCEGCPNQSACASGEAAQEDPAIAQVAQNMADVKHKILVLSGKGGVGKSTVSSQLTWALSMDEKIDVGILDIDICGPSVPRMMAVEDHDVTESNFGWNPVVSEEHPNISVMSVGFMLGSKNDAVIWRGPRKNGLIKQFLTDVHWGALEYLIVDAPPGTSDEHLSLTQYLSGSTVDGAVIVTTPQEVSLLDVRKEINFCKKTGIKVLGVIENMAGFVCPCCKARTDIFSAESSGGAAAMAQQMDVPFLGSVPLDPLLLRACEKGQCFLETQPDAPAAKPFAAVVEAIKAAVADGQ